MFFNFFLVQDQTQSVFFLINKSQIQRNSLLTQQLTLVLADQTQMTTLKDCQSVPLMINTKNYLYQLTFILKNQIKQ